MVGDNLERFCKLFLTSTLDTVNVLLMDDVIDIAVAILSYDVIGI